MTGNDRNPTEPERNLPQDRTEKRTQRSIRFSNTEWKAIGKAARARGIAPAEFVRNAAMNAATAPSSADSVAVPPEIVELIKSNFRYTYILATLKRAEMIDDGRVAQMDRLVPLARQAQEELLSST